jgi:dihydroorotase
VVNESPATAALGLKATPNLAEAVAVARDIEILRYAGGKLHFNKISTAESVVLIQKAKKDGLQITASVAAHHLVCTDDNLENFDTNYKVNPPLRTHTDRLALVQALTDGTIDCVCSDHTPHETDAKHCAFELASDGIIGLETAYALLNSLQKLSTEQVVAVLCTNPRRILNQALPPIAAQQQANLTLFDPHCRWVFAQTDIASRSSNTPFVGSAFVGKVIKTFYA